MIPLFRRKQNAEMSELDTSRIPKPEAPSKGSECIKTGMPRWERGLPSRSRQRGTAASLNSKEGSTKSAKMPQTITQSPTYLSTARKKQNNCMETKQAMKQAERKIYHHAVANVHWTAAVCCTPPVTKLCGGPRNRRTRRGCYKAPKRRRHRLYTLP